MPQDEAPLCPVGLAIHTASPELGLALRTLDGTIKTQCWNLGRSLSTELHDHLSQFVQPLTWTDLDFLAVAKGPGGFTGTRIGVVTARTLAQQLNIPVFAISTLMVLAQAEAEQTFSSPTFESNSSESNSSESSSGASDTGHSGVNLDVAVEMPARRGAVYGAIYRFTLESESQPSKESGLALSSMSLPIIALPDAALPEEKWRHSLETWPHPYRLVTADENLGKSVAQMLTLAHRYWQKGIGLPGPSPYRPHWADALPFYGQSPV
ncbi:MAG: tRNA (adenosine(37)-N6)-threonylcarbamoyltransferase complex dimerization subunit type 1 TsaB [Elainellaceae cyanobacterium]